MSTVAANLTAGSTGAFMIFGAVTTAMSTGDQIYHGWQQVNLKNADLSAQIPASVTIPPIVGNK
jgi:hypothetical protein